jgi:uncharacterized protein (TIGR00255 family)
MSKSMTAFARETHAGEQGELTWELRSVNHRFLETFVRLPEDLRTLETGVRERISVRLDRGKVDCSLRFAPSASAIGELRINHRYLELLLAAGAEVAERLGRPPAAEAFDLLRWPGVLAEQRPDLGPVQAQALTLLDQTLEVLVATRAREGERLATLVRDRCERLLDCVASVRERMPQVMEEVRRRILDRLEEVPRRTRSQSPGAGARPPCPASRRGRGDGPAQGPCPGSARRGRHRQNRRPPPRLPHAGAQPRG